MFHFLAGVSLLALSTFSVSANANRIGVQAHTFADRGLNIEVWDDDLIHFEFTKEIGRKIPFTKMIDAAAAANYAGPNAGGFRREPDFVETAEMRIEKSGDRCFAAYDLARRVKLTEVCPDGRIRSENASEAYGVGNFFINPHTADGDWVGRQWLPRNHGNYRFGPFRLNPDDPNEPLKYDDFHGGGPSVSQFPIFFALGDELANQTFQNYGLLIDSVLRRGWHFKEPREWWTWGSEVRGFLMTGADVKDLRTDYLELTGKPKVPPKYLFGMWASEFGFDNWVDERGNEIKEELVSLKKDAFPVDGVMMDLQWFGGTFDNPNVFRMGTLEFDRDNFPNPKETMLDFYKNFGVHFMTIEESYVDNRLDVHGEMARQRFLAHDDEGRPINVTRDPRERGADNHLVWWGRGGMVDWTNPLAGKFWHERKRLPLSRMGIFSHWLDLGEPEMYYDKSRYHGRSFEGSGHAAVHNEYGQAWAESIDAGYADRENRNTLRAVMRERYGVDEAPRYFTMSRAGTIGNQRYGGMWSGDTGQNMGNLRAHLNTQMHMSLIGVDYYSSDAGGFLPSGDKGIEPGHNIDELYTQWFANNCLTDIPVRPHGWALNEVNDGNKSFSPNRRGWKDSNWVNLMQRYEMTPYLYSLAHRAHLYGEAMFPPPLYHFQGDRALRGKGNLKMIGSSLLFGVVAGFGQTSRPVHLPPGRWANYHSNLWYNGGTTPQISLKMDLRGRRNVLTPPLFIREGGIIPLMHVDEKTRNVMGLRDVKFNELPAEKRVAEEVYHTQLWVKVAPSSQKTEFTVYEDDGVSLAYQSGNVQRTKVSQQYIQNTIAVDVEASEGGTYVGAPARRARTVDLISPNRDVQQITINGQDLPRCQGEQMANAQPCWDWVGQNLLRARSDQMPLDRRVEFRFFMR